MELKALNGSSFSNTLNSASKTLKFPNIPSIFSELENTNPNLSPFTKTQPNGFSFQEILPDTTSKPKPHHNRCRSSNIDILTPKFLFSSKKPLNLKQYRKSFASGDRKQKQSLRSSMVECEELNSTRSFTSQSRRTNEIECSRSLVVNLSKINSSSKSTGLSFCKTCDKLVETSSNARDSELESKLASFFYYFVACWDPNISSKFKEETCQECGNPI